MVIYVGVKLCRSRAGEQGPGAPNFFPEKECHEAFKLIFFYISGMHLHAVSFSFCFWHQTSIPIALSRLNQ